MKPLTFVALLLLAGLLAGCATPAANPAAPIAITLEAGQGGLAGQVAEAPGRWQGEEVLIFAAPFSPVSGQEEGFYVLEPDVHPHTALDANGNFQLGAVKPGKYVLIVGPNAREGKLVMNDKGKPKVFEVKAGVLLQTGALPLAQ